MGFYKIAEVLIRGGANVRIIDKVSSYHTVLWISWQHQSNVPICVYVYIYLYIYIYIHLSELASIRNG